MTLTYRETGVHAQDAVRGRNPASVRAARLMLFLVGLFILLWASYGALTHRRYEAANGVTGEIIRGHSAGQTFIAEYDDLSAVEVRAGTFRTATGESSASLVLHVRTAPTSTLDLATATIPASSITPGNAWYRFSFPSIPDTRDRPLYFFVESPDAEPGNALGLFWFHVDTEGNPYKDGAAFRDGKSEHADLTFGLAYSAPPWQVFSQAARNIIATNGAGVLLAFASLAAAGVIWFAQRKRRSDRAERNLAGLAIALAIALAAGLLNMFITPPWQGPDEHAHFTFVALLERYGLDSSRVRGLDLSSDSDVNALEVAVNSSMDAFDFTRLVANPNPGVTANAGGTMWWEINQPAPYYWLSAAVLHFGRLTGLAPDPFKSPSTTLLWIRGVSVALSLLVVALAWAAGRMLGGKRNPWLSLALPLSVSLLPMHSYMAGVADNDIAAELVCSAAFVCLVALFRRPTGRQGLIFAFLTVLLALGTAFAKASAYALLPFLAMALAVWLFIFHLRPFVLSRLAKIHTTIPPALLVGGGLAVGALLVLVALALALDPMPAPAGWSADVGTDGSVQRLGTDSAHGGHYVMQLDTRNEITGTFAEQMFIPQIFHPTIDVSLTGWVRLAPDARAGSAQAALALVGPQGIIGSKGALLTAPGQWAPVALTTTVAQSDQAVSIQLIAYGPGGAVQFDDLSLQITHSPVPLETQIARYDLINPSFEQEAITLRPGLAGVLPKRMGSAADVILNPQPFQKKNLWIEFAVQCYKSFWGNFGWLAVPLPNSLYWSIATLCLLALIGLLIRGIYGLPRWGWRSWLAVSTGLGLVLAFVGVLTVQTIALAERGAYSFPQGRYFFTAIIPFTWLLLSGLHFVWSFLASRLGIGGAASSGARLQMLSWGEWLLYSALAFFALFCLLDLIVPYFYA